MPIHIQYYAPETTQGRDCAREIVDAAHDLIALGALLQLIDDRKTDDADWEHVGRVCGGIIREIGASVLDSLDGLAHPNLDHNSS
jgi:hypothetical protein